MKIKFHWMHLRKYWIAHKVEDLFRGQMEGIQMENAQVLIGEIREQLSQKGTGRVYNWSRNRKKFRRWSRGGKTYETMGRWKHRASRPGEPPAPWTTRYREGWHFKTWREGKNTVWAQIENPWYDVYGRRLEYGGYSIGRGGGKIYIAPRPHIRPAVARAREFIRYRNQVYRRAALANVRL